METISRVKRKARKDHICDTCGSKIFKGEEYEYTANVDCGNIWGWKSCYHCEPLVRQMFEEGFFPDGYNDTDFDNFLADHPEIEFEIRT